ncbi:MAG: hypothetical protein A3I07_03460 [Candidatus Doudnabacteria bacterium RIFCSPLOWO2_02_FULL_42_9]|uniref:Maf-like protein n=1 Tax=Candidatus Doudnabacteria bacterium RIFCSPHIGHO2_01_FULL_41_86 TaxID=1817821 RepID=A0A1F5N8H0_9BACT|nr:MAG: hypothetical protein A2717_04625 [Candidatus Doudnabacteria bacterium RIFCSPHIGHO2_01_FULL_41_86]OGE75897.1 MAG: hypothetical protein A3K07_04220 [Candidatus Doudnabacteria bacterium RIFCSPHIGHO2_01_43_10]OGE86271.1 MAG: hypothetical protein A3E28_03980 [Candidatus Doudnabacteria bacterium RIFCSPHIGHO2_12_FULL_42_22]OGE87119.1 MAG: hypothetical protein A3C49_03645 [Candidatus Doudnabacteria bacterium RIFCSPHIGHO2_02_FULL_42_25]OGE92259.1 MAG: hypothetical protein A2895_04330 [Candidatus
MKIIICGSISAAEEILSAKKKLEDMRYEVEIPEGVKNLELRGRTEVSVEEKAEDKIKHDLIRGYFEKMKNYDVVLVVNPEKRGVQGYVGGNTLIEMAFGHVLGKKLYVLNPLPELSYTSEILAMQPVVINGNLSMIH